MKFLQFTVLLSAALSTSVGQDIDRLTALKSNMLSSQVPPNFVMRFPQFAVTNAPKETPEKLTVNAEVNTAESLETECGAIEFVAADYDLSWHIVALFLVAGVSLLGSGIPFVVSRIQCLQLPMFMHLLNAFGIGVILATAMIHMLPPANEALNNPCLGLEYEGLAQVIALGTILLIQCLETELVAQLANSNPTEDSTDPNPLYLLSTQNAPILEIAANASRDDKNGGIDFLLTSRTMPGSDSAKTLASRKIKVFIFEAGVALHSIIIGIEIGVASGTTFATLLTAVCFHQCFEGIAVGTSALPVFGDNWRHMLGAILGFVCTTPAGVAIGIIISQSYSPTSLSSLWVQGILDAVAAGILIYTSLVELLTNQMTTNSDFHDKDGVYRGLTYLFVALGACAMAVIGYWA